MTNSDVGVGAGCGRLRIDNSMLHNLTRHLDVATNEETVKQRIGCFDTNEGGSSSMQINATLYNQLKHLFMQATRGGVSGAIGQDAQFMMPT